MVCPIVIIALKMKRPHPLPILPRTKPPQTGTIILGMEYAEYSKLYYVCDTWKVSYIFSSSSEGLS